MLLLSRPYQVPTTLAAYIQGALLRGAAREREARGEAADAADIVHTSKRQEVKELIAALRKNNPSVENNILKSAKNVNLDICLGYVSRGVRHHFMDRYEEGAARGDGADT